MLIFLFLTAKRICSTEITKLIIYVWPVQKILVMYLYKPIMNHQEGVNSISTAITATTQKPQNSRDNAVIHNSCIISKYLKYMELTKTWIKINTVNTEECTRRELPGDPPFRSLSSWHYAIHCATTALLIITAYKAAHITYRT